MNEDKLKLPWGFGGGEMDWPFTLFSRAVDSELKNRGWKTESYVIADPEEIVAQDFWLKRKYLAPFEFPRITIIHERNLYVQDSRYKEKMILKGISEDPEKREFLWPEELCTREDFERYAKDGCKGEESFVIRENSGVLGHSVCETSIRLYCGAKNPKIQIKACGENDLSPSHLRKMLASRKLDFEIDYTEKPYSERYPAFTTANVFGARNEDAFPLTIWILERSLNSRTSKKEEMVNA